MSCVVYRRDTELLSGWFVFCWNPKNLSDLNLVWIFQLITIGIKDLHVFVRISVIFFRNFAITYRPLQPCKSVLWSCRIFVPDTGVTSGCFCGRFSLRRLFGTTVIWAVKSLKLGSTFLTASQKSFLASSDGAFARIKSLSSSTCNFSTCKSSR